MKQCEYQLDWMVFGCFKDVFKEQSRWIYFLFSDLIESCAVDGRLYKAESMVDKWLRNIDEKVSFFIMQLKSTHSVAIQVMKWSNNKWTFILKISTQAKVLSLIFSFQKQQSQKKKHGWCWNEELHCYWNQMIAS